MALKKYDKQWLETLCTDSYSYAEVLKKAGRKQGGGAQAALRKKIKEFNIDTSHFTGQNWQASPNQPRQQKKERYSLDEVFNMNSKVTQKVMRGYVERHNLLEYKCQKCGCNGQWQDGIISLEIDHIDGNNSNNQLTNLRYLCPNCHALTSTYRGKNKKLKAQK